MRFPVPAAPAGFFGAPPSIDMIRGDEAGTKGFGNLTELFARDQRSPHSQYSEPSELLTATGRRSPFRRPFFRKTQFDSNPSEKITGAEMHWLTVPGMEVTSRKKLLGPELFVNISE